MEQKLGRATSCAFTGHRPAALPWGDDERDARCLALKAKLEDAIRTAYRQGFRHFICGMAQGADLYFCEGVVKLRSEFPGITLEAAVPFPGQCDRWSREERERYRALLALCDMETLIQQFHTPGCMQRRNRYMVDHAGLLLAVFNGNPQASGTLGTINYALQQGVRVEVIEV